MSTQMVQFNPGGMPANISGLFGGMAGVEDLTSGAEAAFPILSIKGKVFRVKHGGEERVIQREGFPLQYLDVVIVKANKNLSKLYYAKAYAEGDDGAPSCSSASGVAPDAGVQTPQSVSCATCPHNVWGSKITPQGTKTKACADMRRLALIPEMDMTCKTWGAPLLLRVPAASLQGLSEYARTVLGGKPYSAVVTRISFDPLAAYPKLTFAPVRWLTEAEVPHVMHWMDNPIVGRIIGTDIDPSAPNTQQHIIPIHPVAAIAPAPQLVVQGYVAPATTTAAPPPTGNVIEFAPVVAPIPTAVVAPAPAPVVDPLAGVPEYLKAAVLVVGGPDTDAGKAILATVTAPTAPAPAKRTRRTKAEMAAAPAPVPVIAPVVAAPSAPAPSAPAPSAPALAVGEVGEFITPAAAPPPAPVTATEGNGLLAGVDELLNGLANLSFDD